MGLDAVAWAKEGVARGAGELVVNSIDGDGTRDGYDLVLTRTLPRLCLCRRSFWGSRYPEHLRRSSLKAKQMQPGSFDGALRRCHDP